MTAMTDTEVQGQQPAEPTGLSQVERVVDAYVAPTKTFTDIRRDASWWLPFLLSIVIGLTFAYAVDRQIGFDQVAQANINRNAQAQQRMSTLTDAQRQQSIHIIALTTRIISYAYPVVVLIIALICAGILMMSFNFGLGAKASYKEYLAVWFYAGLPFLIKFLTRGHRHLRGGQHGPIRHTQSRGHQYRLVSHLRCPPVVAHPVFLG